MRLLLVISGLALQACGFSVPDAPGDARPDVPHDVPPDEPIITRVKQGLIGLWTFDDPAGSQFANDTSGTGVPVPLEVITTNGIASPTFAGGSIIAATPVRLISKLNNHLAADCVSAGAVSLEAWVKPALATQGSTPEPTFITGLAASVALRDVALMQAGTRWLAQVRTAGTDGKPNLISAAIATTSAFTHVVVVANATQRVLYINGVAEASGPAAPLIGWDTTYAMSLMDEYQHARPWTGTIAIVAMYNRALTLQEVQQNLAAGATAP